MLEFDHSSTLTVRCTESLYWNLIILSIMIVRIGSACEEEEEKDGVAEV